MSPRDPADIDVIAPNFKKRMSGVTSTIFRLVPRQASQIAIASAGPNLPGDIPQVPVSALVTMPRSGPSGPRVWHARRNNEMLAGLALKYLLGKRLKLLFTSAAQRDHSGYTKWLLRRMDRLVATSASITASTRRISPRPKTKRRCEQSCPCRNPPHSSAAMAASGPKKAMTCSSRR